MILSKELQEKWGLVHVFFCFYKASWRNSSVARWGSTSDNFGLYIYFLEIWFWNIFFKNRRYVEVHKRFDVVVTRKTDWYKQLLRISRKVGGNVKRGLLPIFVNKPPLFPFHIWLGETRRKSFSRPPTFAETSRSCGFPRLEANVFSTRAVHLHTYGIKIYKTTPYLSAQLELVAVWTRFSIHPRRPRHAVPFNDSWLAVESIDSESGRETRSNNNVTILLVSRYIPAFHCYSFVCVERKKKAKRLLPFGFCGCSRPTLNVLNYHLLSASVACSSSLCVYTFRPKKHHATAILAHIMHRSAAVFFLVCCGKWNWNIFYLVYINNGRHLLCPTGAAAIWIKSCGASARFFYRSKREMGVRLGLLINHCFWMRSRLKVAREGGSLRGSMFW